MTFDLKPLGHSWLLIALIAGCGDSPVETVDPLEPIDLSGVWDFTEVLFRSTQPVVCRDTGSYWLANDHNTIAGAGEKIGTCEGLVGDFSDARTFTVRDGVVRDSLVEFVIGGGCGSLRGTQIDARYTGTVSRGPPLRMGGSSACSVNFNGLWEATRAAPTASIEIRPDSAAMVMQETIYLKPIIWSASGARLFERDLTWTSSDTAVARVAEDGSVYATGIGATTIEVSNMGLTADAKVATRSVSFTSVHAGAYHTCGLSADGEAFCWGANEAGQSGPSPSLAPCPGVLCRRAPGAVPGSAQFGELNGGASNTCGVALDGSAHCWGGNSVGQLGIGQTTAGTQTPQMVLGGHTFSLVSAGSGHVCGVAEGGLVHCWGSNNRGQAGPSESDPGTVPFLVSSELSFISVDAGGLHSCGLAIDGVSYCWGWNWDSQLGNDTIPSSSEPLAVSGDLIFASITVGAAHNCGLTHEGVAYCWGDGEWGQLGIDSIDYMETPTAVEGGLRFASLTAGAYHTCGLAEDGSAFCWGEGSYGRLGDGSGEDYFSPVAVSGGYRFSSLTAGAEHTCGMTVDGLAYCWGSNFNGQLGQSSIDPSAVPLKVIGQL
jgi:alpha-tubulin suppressor-like RCC1 family protein